MEGELVLFMGWGLGWVQRLGREVAQMVGSHLWWFCVQDPAFARRSERQLGFWCLCTLWCIICPDRTDTQFFLVPYSFLAFYCSRRHLSMCKHCSKMFQVPDPRAQPVSELCWGINEIACYPPTTCLTKFFPMAIVWHFFLWCSVLYENTVDWWISSLGSHIWI